MARQLREALHSGGMGMVLSHREPKTFALIYTNGAGIGGAPAVSAAAAASNPVVAGDAVEILKDVTFRMPAEAEVRAGPCT